MTTVPLEKMSLEDLEATVRHGLDSGEPCICGDPMNESLCPACGAATRAQEALTIIMKYITEGG